MDSEKTLVLSFKKTNGNAFSFNVPYPKDEIVAADVLALANFMIQNKIIVFKDNSEIATFEKAYVQEVSKTTVNTNI
ncbi:MAG: DUF2922 domain-containing protein [Proteocatella sp.]